MGDTSHPTTEQYDLLVADDSDFEDILTCIFGISRTEANLYLTMLEYPESTAAELADVVDHDRSHIHRSLSTLQERGLIERERHLLEDGGHVYRHTAIPLHEAKDLMHGALDKWVDCVHERIDQFGQP